MESGEKNSKRSDKAPRKRTSNLQRTVEVSERPTAVRKPTYRGNESPKKENLGAAVGVVVGRAAGR